MTRRTLVLALALLTLASTPAPAWDGATIQQAQGDLTHDIWVAATPTPGFCYWNSTDGATGFHATEADGYGNMDCPHPWLMHCDADSLAFIGSYPEIDLSYVIGADYGATLACTVAFADRTRLTALREVTGALASDVHTVTLTWPDGTVQPLLAEGAGTDQAEVVVPPGVYAVAADVYAYEAAVPIGHVAGYAGRVVVAWEDAGPVPLETTSWSRVKSLYRR